MERYRQRRDKLRKLLAKSEAEWILVTNEPNVSYLTGFWGDSSWLLLGKKHELLFSDFRYITQLEEECPGLPTDIRKPGVTLTESIAETLKKFKVHALAIEADAMTVSVRDALGAKCEGVEFVSTKGLVLELRQIKDKEEIDAIRVAIACAEKAFGVIRATLRPEQTEKEVGDLLDHHIRLFGGTGCSFPPIVGVGQRGALPHGKPSEKRIGEDPFVLIDWGARSQRYISDLTRVLVTGKISPKLERVYGVVLNAQKQAIEAIKPGAVMEDIDAIARNAIAKAGFGKYFGHSLGHGIGLEVHEQPRLAIGDKRPLAAGMVVTVEPGIYLPDWGGVRIEDDILVTRTGHEVLTSVPKELEECVVV